MGLGGITLEYGPYLELLTQVNRFTGKTAGVHAFAQTPFPVAMDPLSTTAAYTALLIYQARLLVAQAGIADPSTAQQIAAVNAALSKAPAYVVANKKAITDAIKGYADNLGLPYVDQNGQPISRFDAQPFIVAAAIGFAAYYLFGRKRKGA